MLRAAALFSNSYLDQVEIEAILMQAPLCPTAVTDIPAPRRPKQPNVVRCQTDINATDPPPQISPNIVSPDVK